MTEAHHLSAAVEELQRRGWTVTPPDPDPPEPVCSRCMIPESGTVFGYLVPVEVEVNAGEEGHAAARRQYCDPCASIVVDGLIELGFGVHRHDGINFLEPGDCPGRGKPSECPTPADADDWPYG